MENKFQESLQNKNEFTVTLEVLAGRGSFEKAQENALAVGSWVAKDPRISAVSITDSPGGKPGLVPESIALEFMKLGVEPILHYTLKDKNRIHVESELYGYHRAELHNLIVMTGDFPKEGYQQGIGKPVFDLDPIQTLALIDEMNRGLQINERVKVKKTDFFSGCVVTPFKNVEAEIITEYLKLEKKVRAGADFIVSQVGYDMRKFHELRQLTMELFPEIPLIGNIFILDHKLAELIHLHCFTGCTIPERLYEEIMSAEDTKEKSLLRGAKMFAVMKGMGYDGVHIGGEGLTAEDIDFVLKKGAELAADWESCLKDFEGFDDGAFYYYQRNDRNGLNTPEKTDLSALPVTADLSWNYRLERKLHHSVFERNGFGAKTAAALGRCAAKGGFWRKAERAARAWLFQCRDCGDCALAFTDMICPMSRCPKQQRNGPCGGSRNGFCEVYPGEKECIYVTAYQRLKKQGKTESLQAIVPAPDCGLYGSSELNNYFTARDTFGKMKNSGRSL